MTDQSFADYFEEQQSLRARQAAVANLDANPDESAKALTLSKATGAPSIAIEQNPKMFQDMAHANTAAQVIKENPQVQQYVEGNPAAPRVSKDDYANLNVFSKALKALGSWVYENEPPEVAINSEPPSLDALQQTDVAKGFKGGMLQSERGGLAFGDMILSPSQERENRLLDIEKSLKDLDTPDSFMAKAGGFFGGMIPSLTETGVGMGAGALAGLPAGGVGAIPGAIAGGNIGLAESQGRISAGNVYRDLIQQGMDPTIAKITALSVGTVVGALNAVPVGSAAAKTFITTAQREIEKKAITAVTAPAVTKVLTSAAAEIGKESLKGSAIFGLQEALTEVGQSVAKEVNNKLKGTDFPTLINDFPDELARISDLTVNSMIDGAMLVGAMHIPGIGVNRVADAMRIKQASLDNEMLANVLKARDATLTFPRAPELIKEFTDKHDLNDFGLDPQAVMDIAKRDPNALKWIENLEQRALEAAVTGDKVHVSPGDYLANGPAPLHEQLREDISVNGNMTIREANVLQENPPEYPQVYHGSPWLREDHSTYFDDSKFMSGEGNNTYGEGHYVTEHPGIAEYYKNAITELHNSEQFFHNGEAIPKDAFDPRYQAQEAVGEGLADGRTLEEAKAYAKEQLQYAIDHQQSSPYAQKPIVPYEQTMAAIDGITMETREDLFPHTASGKVKAAPEEMTDLRKPVEQQSENARIAFEQIRREVEANHNDYLGKFEQEIHDNEAKHVLELADDLLGKDRVRQIFIENGIKAHKYETTQSQGKGGEVWSKEEGRFLRGSEIPKELEKRLPYGSVDTALARLKERNAQLEKYIEADKQQLALGDQNGMYDLNATRAAIEKAEKELQENNEAIDLFEGRNDKYELRPAHNYVILQGKDFELTHINGVPVEPLEPPKALVEPKGAVEEHAAEIYSQSKDLVTQVAEAEQRAAGVDQLFKDAKAAGMTKAEFTLYQRRLAEMDATMRDKAFAAAEREAKKRLSKEWKENRAAMRSEVSEDLFNTPDMVVIRWLLGEGDIINSKIKLGLEDVKDQLAGRNKLDDLPKGVTAKNGLDTDVVGKLYGFASGKDFLDHIIQMEDARRANNENWKGYRDRLIDQETDRRMEAKYGDLGENIKAEARDAALNAKALNVLSAELEQIAKLGGIDKPFDREEIKATAKDIFDRRVLERNKTKDWTKSMGDFARKAELMLLRGKFDEAYMAKQRQMLAYHMLQLSKDLDRAKTALDKKMAPYVKNEMVRNTSERFVTQIQKILGEAFGVPLHRDLDELNRSNPPHFMDFVKDELGKGNQIDVPDWLWADGWLDPNNKMPRSVGKLNVSQFYDLKDMLYQLRHHGKEEAAIKLGAEKVAIDEARKRMVESARKNKEAWVKEDWKHSGPVGKGLGLVKAWDAMNLRPERLLDWLDRRDPNGPWNQGIMRPFQEAKGIFQDKVSEVARAFKALGRVENSGRVLADSPFRLYDDVRGTFHEVPATRETLIAAMLNTGNDGNLQVLARGYHTDPQTIMAWIDQHATAADWKWVQGVWDAFDKHLFDFYEKAARDNTGVGLFKVEPREITNQHGTFKGGYYPLIEDFSSVGRKQKNDPFDQGKIPPYPTASYMKRRTGAAYPLDLSFDRIAAKINEGIYYASFAKPWKDANKLLQSSGVQMAIKDTFGEQYRSQLGTYMNRIADNGRVGTQTGLEGLMKSLGFLRENMIATVIGFRPGTAVLHGGAALFNSMREAGVLPFAKATWDLAFKSPQDFDNMRAFVLEKSSEVRNRSHNLDRDLAQQAQLAINKGTLSRVRAGYISYATKMVSVLDQASAIPTWLAAYNKYMREFDGKFSDAEERAIYAADKIVRNAHGSNSFVDLPAIMDKNEALKWFTAFGGFFNHVYNQLRDTGKLLPEGIDALKNGDLKQGSVKMMGFIGGMMGYVIAGSMIHGLVRGQGNQDLGHFLGESILDQLMATQPFVRDVWYWWKTGARDKVNVASPLGELLTGWMAPIGDLANKKTPPHWVQHVAELPTWTVGVGPTRYMAQWMDFLGNYLDGRQRMPEGYLEWRKMILDAKAPPKKRAH